MTDRHTHTPTHTHPTPRHTHTHTHKSKKKAKFLATTRVTRTWQSQGTCAPSRYYVPVLRAISWSRARNSQEHQLCLALQVWAPEVPPTPLVTNETQPVYFAPQYKTRYPFYRWVGWWAGVLVMFFSSRSGIRTSVLWVVSPRLYQLNH